MLPTCALARYARCCMVPAAPAAAQLVCLRAERRHEPGGPSRAYVTAGQDEPGYRNWYMATPAHPMAVKASTNI